MLIRNYGLFWREENIFWGWPGVAGHLKGVPHDNKTTIHPLNFRDQQGVYALYDSSFQLVYVGQAGVNRKRFLFDRLKDHTTDNLADRWDRFSWFGLRWIKQTTHTLAQPVAIAHSPNNAVLDHIEAILVAVAEPPHNRQGGRFGEATQYLQYRDPRLDDDEAD